MRRHPVWAVSNKYTWLAEVLHCIMLAQSHHKFIHLTRFYHFCTGAGDPQIFALVEVLHWRKKANLTRFCTGAKKRIWQGFALAQSANWRKWALTYRFAALQHAYMLILSYAYISGLLYKNWLMLGKPPQFYHMLGGPVKLRFNHTQIVGVFERTWQPPKLCVIILAQITL